LKTKKLYEFIDIIIDIICVLMRILKIPVISRVSILLLTRLYHSDPDYRAKVNATTHNWRKKKQAEDPEYDEKVKQKWRECAQKARADPDKQARKLECQRLRRQQKKLLKQQIIEKQSI
jgi:hypothetical protein